MIYESDRLFNLLIAIRENIHSISEIKRLIGLEDYYGASEIWRELTNDEKKSLWCAPSRGGVFTTKEREIIRTEIQRIIKEDDRIDTRDTEENIEK